MQKKVLVYGEDWLGTLPNLVKEDLRKRGYDVAIFDWTLLVPGIRNRSYLQRIQRRLLQRFFNQNIMKEFLNVINKSKPDLIFVSKGLNLEKEFLFNLRKFEIPMHNWNPDDFYSVKNSNQNLLSSMSAYTSIISARRHLFKSYINDGARKTIHADWYYEPSLHSPTTQAIQREISFVGSWSIEREKFLFEIERPIDIWGSGWNKARNKFRSKHRVHDKVLSQRVMSEVFSTSKYNINLLTRDNNDMSNLRMYEVSASRGTLVTPRNAYTENLFHGDEGCFMFDNPDDVNRIIKIKDKDRLGICNRGFELITGGKHTFSDRMDSILKELQY